MPAYAVPRDDHSYAYLRLALGNRRRFAPRCVSGARHRQRVEELSSSTPTIEMEFVDSVTTDPVGLARALRPVHEELLGPPVFRHPDLATLRVTSGPGNQRGPQLLVVGRHWVRLSDERRVRRGIHRCCRDGYR